MILRYRFAFAVGALVVLSCAVPTSSQTKPVEKPPSDQDIDVVKVETTLVTVPTTIKEHGKVVTDLKREQFHIFEDGVEQQIVYFDPPDSFTDTTGPTSPALPEQKPLTVALLIDVSDSTEFRLKKIREAAVAFCALLRPDDRALVMSFDKNVNVLAGATSDRETLRSSISRLQTGGGTSIYEAIDSAMNWFVHTSGRKAIVVLTDGVDTASPKATYDSTLSMVARADVIVYPIQYDTYSDFADSASKEGTTVGITTMGHATKNGEPASEAYKRARTYLSELARLSGGTLRFSDSVKNLTKAFAQVAAQLREQYTLGYYPTNKTASRSPRTIKVTVDRPSLNISNRKSYVYAPR